MADDYWALTFDHTRREGNSWYKAAAEKLRFDEHCHAYSALLGTLHDCMIGCFPEMSVNFGAVSTGCTSS